MADIFEDKGDAGVVGIIEAIVERLRPELELMLRASDADVAKRAGSRFAIFTCAQAELRPVEAAAPVGASVRGPLVLRLSGL